MSRRRTSLQPDAFQRGPDVGGSLAAGGADVRHLRQRRLQTRSRDGRGAQGPWSKWKENPGIRPDNGSSGTRVASEMLHETIQTLEL